MENPHQPDSANKQEAVVTIEGPEGVLRAL